MSLDRTKCPDSGCSSGRPIGASVLNNVVTLTNGSVVLYGIRIQPFDDNSVSADFPASATVQRNTVENAAVGIRDGDATNPNLTQISNNTFNNVDEEILLTHSQEQNC